MSSIFSCGMDSSSSRFFSPLPAAHDFKFRRSEDFVQRAHRFQVLLRSGAAGLLEAWAILVL